MALTPVIHVDTTSWLHDGSGATKTNIGIDNGHSNAYSPQLGSNWTFVNGIPTPSALWSGAPATGKWIELADGVGASLFQPVAASQLENGWVSGHKFFCLTGWIYYARNSANTLAADGYLHTSASDALVPGLNLGSHNNWCDAYLYNNEANGGVSGVLVGWTQDSPITRQSATSANGKSSHIPLNKWMRYSIVFIADTAANGGGLFFYLNGSPVSKVTGIDFSGTNLNAFNKTMGYLVPFTVAGLKIRLGEFWVFDQANNPSTFSTSELAQCGMLPMDTTNDGRVNVVPTYASRQRSFDVDMVDTSASNLVIYGSRWVPSGSGAIAIEGYSSGGVNPFRARARLTSASGTTKTLTTEEEIGAIPFNAEGVVVLFAPMVYVPDYRGAWKWETYNAGATTDMLVAVMSKGRLCVGGMPYGDAWSGAVTYVAGDVVYFNNVMYTCILGHTNHTPPNGTYWAVFTAQAHSVTGTSTAVAASVVNVTAHGFRVGDIVWGEGNSGSAPDDINGIHTVLAVTDQDHFTIDANCATTGGSGGTFQRVASVAAYNPRYRYQVALALDNTATNGRVAFLLKNISLEFASGHRNLIHAGEIGTFPQGNIGKFNIKLFQAATGNTETDGIMVCQYLDALGVDSYIEAALNNQGHAVNESPATTMAGWNRLGDVFDHGEAYRTIPGGACVVWGEDLVNDTIQPYAGLVIASSGGALDVLADSIAPQLGQFWGLRFWLIMGAANGAVNHGGYSLAGITDAGKANTTAAVVKQSAQNAVYTILANRRNRVVIVTPLMPTASSDGGSALTANQKLYWGQIVVNHNALASDAASNFAGLVKICDVATDLGNENTTIFGANNLHPIDPSGANAIVRSMKATMRTPSLGSGGGGGATTGGCAVACGLD